MHSPLLITATLHWLTLEWLDERNRPPSRALFEALYPQWWKDPMCPEDIRNGIMFGAWGVGVGAP